MVSAPSPRGRGLQDCLGAAQPAFHKVSAPSPRGRGLQVVLIAVAYFTGSVFQRHRPGEGDCKIPYRDRRGNALARFSAIAPGTGTASTGRTAPVTPQGRFS